MSTIKEFSELVIDSHKEVFTDIWRDEDSRKLLIRRITPYIATPIILIATLYALIVIFI